MDLKTVGVRTKLVSNGAHGLICVEEHAQSKFGGGQNEFRECSVGQPMYVLMILETRRLVSGSWAFDYSSLGNWCGRVGEANKR